MRVRTFLRVLRGDRSLGDAAAVTGLARGDLSRIELGHMLPDDRHLAALVRFYGPSDGWYPAGVDNVLHHDPPVCPGCGKKLEPSALPNRRYHNEGCRKAARKGVVPAVPLTDEERRDRLTPVEREHFDHLRYYERHGPHTLDETETARLAELRAWADQGVSAL